MNESLKKTREEIYRENLKEVQLIPGQVYFHWHQNWYALILDIFCPSPHTNGPIPMVKVWIFDDGNFIEHVETEEGFRRKLMNTCSSRFD